MKKSLKLIGFVAVAAATVIGCAKEENVQIPEETAFTHTVTFHTGALATKTVLVEGVGSSAFKWSADDASRFYLTESGVAGTDISIASPDDYETITLSATFSHGTAPSEYTYEGVLAKTRTNSNKPRVPATQTSSATSFDPNADVLVAKSQTFATAQSELSLQFARPVAVSKMTLMGLTAGETVNKVTITSDKDITGYFDVTGNAWTGDNHILTVNTDLLVPASGEVSVYFMSMPLEEATLTVVAETEGFKYTKTFGKTISLALQKVNVFGVQNFAKEAKADLSGYYLIGSYYDSKWQLMSSENGGSYYSRLETSVATEAASVDFSEFSGIANINDYIWQVEAYMDGYSIKSVATNKYVTWEVGSKNSAKAAETLEDDDVLYIDITGAVATITNGKDDTRKLKYNSGSPRFAFYTTAQTGLCLIPATVDTRTAVTLSFDEAVLNYTTANYGDCVGQDVTVDPNVTAITDNILWSYTDEDNIIDDVDPDTGFVALHGTTGSATITATFDGDANYRPATASYTIVVTDAGANDGSLEHPYTVSEALDIISGYSDKQKSATEVYVTGIIANVGSYNASYHSVTYDISDDGQKTNTLNIYSGRFVADTDFSSNTQIEVGDEVIVCGYLYLYSSTQEMYQGNYIYSLNGGTKALTAGSLTTTSDDANKQITVEWGAATGSTEPISYVVTCGTQNYNADAAGSHTFTMADYGNYTVTVVASASDAYSATVSTVATLTDPGAGTNYATTNTSNVTLATTGGTKAYVSKVSISGTEYDAIKCGTSSAAGAMKLTVPSGSTKLHVHLAAWSTESSDQVTISPNAKVSSTNPLSISADSGVSGSGSTYTLANAASDYYFCIDLTGITEDTEFTFSATTGKRFVIWGVNFEK